MNESLFGNEPAKQMKSETPKKFEKDKFDPKLKGGYKFDEVASALQKCVRRGLEREASFWAMILFKSGFSGYLKRRLAVIIHEDVGVANPIALIMANQLYADGTTKKVDKKYESASFRGDDFLPIVNAIVIACRGKKTRIGDELINLLQDGIDKWGDMLEMPEYAIDPHTDRGKEKHGYWESGTREQSQTRIKNWFDKWAMLDNEATEEELPNPYKEELKTKWGYYDASKAPVREDRNEKDY